MIVSRYLQRSVYIGTAGALLLLVGLGLFFTFVGELDNLKNQYGMTQVLQYLALTLPGKIVEFLPLAVLLGSMLALGALASNSELIAMQASGVSLARMLLALLQAGVVIALISFLLSEWVVPQSEVAGRKIRNLQHLQTATLDSGKGLWIKDETRVVRIEELLPNGFARGIEIYQLDGTGKLESLTRAEHAEPLSGGWRLFEVRQTRLDDGQSSSEAFDSLDYQGNLSHNLLQVMLIKPRRMSSRDLYQYLEFLHENRLDAEVERLVFWQKLFAPLTIVIMALLAFPFVTGSQRQSNTGKRLLIGILLGLCFVAANRVLTQLGTQIGMDALLVALLPNLVFLMLTLYLLFGQRSAAFGRLLRLGLTRGRKHDDAGAA